MPMYTYRREDGTTFDLRQNFSDAPLAIDPQTGQKVTRIVQAAGVIFKGSGFYVTDNKGASKSTAVPTANTDKAPKVDATPTSNTPAPAPVGD